jgi:hypothetical protein
VTSERGVERNRQSDGRGRKATGKRLKGGLFSTSRPAKVCEGFVGQFQQWRNHKEDYHQSKREDDKRE